MKHIFIYRHADTHPAASGQTDFARDLTPQGQDESRRMGEWLKNANLGLPERILCSTAARAESTLRLTLDAMGQKVPVTHEQRLYLAAPSEIFRVVNELGGEENSLMVVGHNPGLHQFALSLAHKGLNDLGKLAFQFPTASLAVFEVKCTKWNQLEAEPPSKLIQFITPKDIA